MNRKSLPWLLLSTLAAPLTAGATSYNGFERHPAAGEIAPEEDDDHGPSATAKPTPSPTSMSSESQYARPALSGTADDSTSEKQYERPAMTAAQPTPTPEPYVAKGPHDLPGYLAAQRTPKYIHVDIDNYNIRENRDFSTNRTDNITGKTSGEKTYKVLAVKPMTYGYGVQVVVSEDEPARWIYVPRYRKDDFQFCETRDCFPSALSQSLDFFLQGTNISVAQAQACGVTVGPDGHLVLPSATEPSGESDIPVPSARPEADAKAPRPTSPTPASLPAKVDVPPARPTDVLVADAQPKSAQQQLPEGKDAPIPQFYRDNPPKAVKPAAAANDQQDMPEQYDTALPEANSEDFSPQVRPLWQTQHKNWTGIFMAALDKYGKGLENTSKLGDARTYCPNYSKLSRTDRKEFWLHLFNGMGFAESRLNNGPPALRERRPGIPQKRFSVGVINPDSYSMGLFALSYNVATYNVYQPGCAGINFRKDRNKRVESRNLTIYNDQAQMECAITMMNYWVKKDGVVGTTGRRGGSRFWSTLRLRNGNTKNTLKQVRRFTPCWK